MTSKKLFLIVATLCCTAALHAQELGQIPYSAIHNVWARGAKVKHPRLRPIISYVPQAPGVKPRDVTLVIQAKSGPIKITLDDDGEIRSFPANPALLAENPMVQTNQPKGTSQLRAGLGIVLPETLTYSYRELAQLLDEANAEIKKQAGGLSFVAPRAKTLVFHFRTPAQQTVTVNTKPPQTLTAGSDGTLALPIDKKIAAEDPKITVSEKPVKIMVN